MEELKKLAAKAFEETERDIALALSNLKKVADEDGENLVLGQGKKEQSVESLLGIGAKSDIDELFPAKKKIEIPEDLDEIDFDALGK